MTEYYKEILTKIKESKFWNILMSKHDVLLMHIIGSNLTGLLDEKSDLDILVICSDISQNHWEDVYRFDYKGCPVHLCYHQISSYLQVTPCIQLNQLHGVTCQYLKKDHFIYIKPGCEKLVDKLLEMQKELSIVGCNYFIYCGKDLIHEWMNTQLLDDSKYCKWLHHILLCWDILENANTDVSFLTRIKRIKYTGISEEDRSRCIEKLKYVSDYLTTLNIEETRKNMTVYNQEINDYYLSIKENIE